jgi:acyl-[acyl-carrier-protein]-phospholipid O-acyltransferase/long-chain-fatty-acid--[acyl-carrier-protein] ligase
MNLAQGSWIPLTGTTVLANTPFDSNQTLAITAVVVLTAAVVAWRFRAALLRRALRGLTRLIYRLRLIDSGNVPGIGGAVLAPNHIAFIDGLFLIASVDRPIRFLVHSKMYHKWWLYPFMRALGAIEISPTGGPRIILKALRDAGHYLDAGEIVCIFPEGQLSRTGTMLPFQRGLERLAKGRDVPIIPVHLDRVWGSVFSYKYGKFVTKMPERLRHRVTVTFGEPVPSDTPVRVLRKTLMEMGTRAWSERRTDRKPLHRTFIRQARLRPRGVAVQDGSGSGTSRLRFLTSGVALARALRERWGNARHIGILLPSSVAAATINLSAALSGRVSVHLNFTTGQAAFDSAIRQAGLESVVTSRAFMEKCELKIPDGLDVVWIEDVVKGLGRLERFVALLFAALAPMDRLERSCGATRPVDLDDDTTVLFSSGSTGDPKGVILTNYNVDSNVEAVAQVLGSQDNDRILGSLPLFHSFGFLSLWFALNHRIGIVFQPNPLDGAAVATVVARERVTMLLATPTFLQSYLRRAQPGSFGSLRIVLSGAERLSPRLRDAFEERFGIRPIEGYGATECSPAIATGAPDVRYDGVYQAGSRPGSVGQPVPGVTVRIVDPDTGAHRTDGQPGVILVRGPNVMRGYLGRDDLTREVLRDGWYNTGDIGRLDDDGFLYLTGRESRFSKIGGEMVPHVKVEDALHSAANAEDNVFAVTGVPDDRKGERLVVLHTLPEDRIDEIVNALPAQGLPNLFIPRPNQFIAVPALPSLGSGKLDLRKIREIAEQTASSPGRSQPSTGEEADVAVPAVENVMTPPSLMKK